MSIICVIHLIKFANWSLQPKECNGLDSDDIDAIIPKGFWLYHKACTHILSVKVHRKNQDVITVPAAAPPEMTRKEQRQMKTLKLQKQRKLAAEERDAAVAVRADLKAKEHKIREAMARESILSSRKKRETATIKNASKKLKMLKMTKDIFIEKHGEDAWKEEVNKCMMEMLGKASSDDGSDDRKCNTSVSVADDGKCNNSSSVRDDQSEDDSGDREDSSNDNDDDED